MKKLLMNVVAFIAFVLAGSAAAADIPYPLIGDPAVFTQVNLHPDETKKLLYSINYQQPGLMPLCTKVKIISVTDRKMVFELANGGQKYEYAFHDKITDPIPKHLNQYFGKSCTRNKADALSAVDKQGIKEGRATLGMTKEGVVLAIGYPPSHATPGTQANEWRYWKNRFATMLVHFQNGKVTKID